MAEQPHGSEFMLGRLQRAAAIPAAERTPDVAAFVESVQLLREACDLLPLTRDGWSALQFDSAADHQQVTLALLKLARANYICPAAPVSDREVGRHVGAYCCSGMISDSGNLLTTMLVSYARLLCSKKATSTAAAMLDQLATPAAQHVISGQLAQLAAAYPGQPLLSFKQLHCACCCAAVGAARFDLCTAPFLNPQHQATGAEQQRAATTMSRAAATILALEPENPGSYATAAFAEVMVEAERAPLGAQQVLRLVELYTQGRQLAMQQGNLFFTAHCAADAVESAFGIAESHRPTWHEAVAAFEGAEAEAAVRRCKRLLPALWADGLETAVQRAQQAIQAAQRQLQSQTIVGYEGLAESELMGIMDAVVQTTMHISVCDGCGQRAVGLRRCSRCKTAQYCSTKCQHQHWRVHKRECREA